MWGTFSVDVRQPVHSKNWQKCHTDLLCNCGFRVFLGHTCMFGHQERDTVVLVHGDVVSTAGIEDLLWLESMPKEKFEITTSDTMEWKKTTPLPSPVGLTNPSLQEIHENPLYFCMVFVPKWQTRTQTNPDRPRSSQTGPNRPKPAQTLANTPKLVQTIPKQPTPTKMCVCVCLSVCLSVLVRFGSVWAGLGRVWAGLVIGAFYSGPLTSENVNNKLLINKFLEVPKS